MPTGNTQQQINYGATANDGQGDPLRTAFIKTDENFDNIWLAGPAGSNVRITNNTIGVIDTNGNLILSPNGVGVIQTNNNVVPRANRTYDLGSANLQYRTVYANSAALQTLSVSGNLTVSGNIINTGNIVTDTLTIQLANTTTTANAANGAGITVGASDNIATILYNSASNVWTTNIGVSATGNITAPYFIGNGSQLTGITSSYGNSNVTTLLGNLGSNIINGTGNITTTANISGGNILGNGRQLTGIVSSYGNANVVTLLSGFGSNTIATTGNVSAGNVLTSAEVIASGVIQSGTGLSTGGYLSVNGTTDLHDTTITGNLSVSIIKNDDSTIVKIEDGVEVNGDAAFNGNITAANLGNIASINLNGNASTVLYGNGTFAATNSYGNANVTTLLGNLGSNVISGTGNIVSNNITIIGTTQTINARETLTLAAGGQFNICTILTGGSGYNTGSALKATTGGSGTGMTVGIGYGLSNQLSNVGVVDPGTGYVDGDVITVSGGTGGTFRITRYNDQANQANNNFIESDWTFGNAGNLTLPGNIIAINYANGNRVTGNVTFRDEIVIGTGTSNVISGLYLAPSSSSADANMYLRVRGNVNDEPTHIHFDTGNNQYYNQFIGDDNKYIQLANTGNIVVNSNDAAGNSAQWIFGANGNLTVPGGIVGSGESPAPTLSGFSSISAITFGATGQIVSTASGNSADGGGQIYLNGATNNRIDWNTNGTGAPAFTTRSAGSKIVLYPLTNGTNTDYAIGINSGTFWSSVPQYDTALQFKWYGGITEIASLSGTGVFSAIGNITSTANVSGGNLITAGLISATGNITGGNLITAGLISAAGNISANNLSLAGNITSSIGFTGATITINNAPGGNEGAEVIWALPSPANTVLTTSLVQDVFQNGMRFFESGGNTRGLYMDLGNVPNGSGTAVGYRDIPQVAFTANTTLAATDAGRHYYSTLATANTLTIANNTSVSWSVGSAISIVNRGTGNITVAQGTGVSLYLAGNATAGNRTVTTYGMATLLNVAANVWMINGTGVA